MTAELIEKVARIVDPLGWSTWDYAVANTEQAGFTPVTPDEHAVLSQSLSKATAIHALYAEPLEDARISVLAELRQAPADEEIRKLMSSAQIAGGHPADDDDLSNDAIIGREFIRLRHKIAAALSSLLPSTEDAE